MGRVSDRVQQIVRPVLNNQGLELVDVEYVKEGGDWFLRIFIDNENSDVNIGDCENISRIVSDLLDTEDPIAQAYNLEVSTPGIERPLKKLADFKKIQGKLAYIKTYAPINGQKEFAGKITKTEDNNIFIKTDKEEIIKISYNSIAKANLTNKLHMAEK